MSDAEWRSHGAALRARFARSLRTHEIPNEQLEHFVRTFPEGEVVKAVAPTMLFAKVAEVEMGINWDSTPGFSRRVSDLMADLIDRPTCHVIDDGQDWPTCSRCNYDGWADLESVTRFCPDCGAEVVGRWSR